MTFLAVLNKWNTGIFDLFGLTLNEVFESYMQIHQFKYEKIDETQYWIWTDDEETVKFLNEEFNWYFAISKVGP